MPDQRDAAEAARPNKKSKVEEKKKPPAPGKGLKHFSMKICERVKGMGSTSYNLVADEVRTCFNDSGHSNTSFACI